MSGVAQAVHIKLSENVFDYLWGADLFCTLVLFPRLKKLHQNDSG